MLAYPWLPLVFSPKIKPANLVFSSEKIEKPKKEPKARGVRNKLVVDYFRDHTKTCTDALEKLISCSKLDPEYLDDFRKILYRSREHLGGFHGPMMWNTLSESMLYVAKMNQERDDKYELEQKGDKFLVYAPDQMYNKQRKNALSEDYILNAG